jgi:FkbM family methyltransferase
MANPLISSLPKAIAQSLSQAFPDGLPLPILKGPLKGCWWATGSAPGPSKGLSVLANQSEPRQLARGAQWARQSAVCLDIGAHAGLYSLLFGRLCETVYAFEPLPANIALLQRTLALNGLHQVNVLPWAMGGKSGILRFEPHSISSRGALSSKGTLPVYCVTLPEFLKQESIRPDLIKVDIEGAEVDWMETGFEVLRDMKPRLLLSTHGESLRSRCLELAKEAGYASCEPLDHRDPGRAWDFALS